MDTVDLSERRIQRPDLVTKPQLDDSRDDPTPEILQPDDPLVIARQFQRLEYNTEQDLKAIPKEPLTLRERFDLRRRAESSSSRLRFELLRRTEGNYSRLGEVTATEEVPPRIRSGIALFIQDHDWIQLFDVMSQNRLTLTERAYLFQHIEPDVDDPDLLPLVGVVRQLLGGQNKESQYQGITLRPELQELVCVMMDGRDSLDKYRDHLMKLDSDTRKGIIRSLVLDVKEAMVNQSFTEEHLESSRLEPVGALMEPLVRKYGRDISVIREVISEQLEAGIQSSDASGEDYLRALALVNPGKLLALCIDGSLSESQMSAALDACLFEDPQMVVNACAEGRLPKTALGDRAIILARDNPSFAIAHLDDLSESPELRSQISLDCLRAGNLEELFQALENTSSVLSLDEDTLRKARDIVKQRLEEGYSQLDSPERKLRYIRRFAAYPFVSQEPVLGELRDRFDYEVADALYPHVLAFIEKNKDLDAFKLAEKLFKEFSVQRGPSLVDDLFAGSKFERKNRTDGLRLDEYSFFSRLSKKQQRCILGMSMVRNDQNQKMSELAYELIEPEILKPYGGKAYVPEYSGNALVTTIIEHVVPTDVFAVSAVEHIVNTNEDVPDHIRDELVEWLMKGIVSLEEQMCNKQDYESQVDPLAIDNFVFLVSKLKDEALTDRFVALLSKFPDEYYLALPGRTDDSLFGLFIQTLSPQQQERLLWSQKHPLSTLSIFSQLQFGSKERKRELFDELKANGNTFISQFTDYAQYVAYLQEFPHFDSESQVRAVLDLQSSLGIERWKLFAKAARRDPDLTGLLAETSVKVLERVLTSDSPLIKELLLSNPRLLIQLHVSDSDIQFFTDTATKIRADIPRLIADMKSLGIDISDEQRKELEGEMVTADSSKETREKQKQMTKVMNAYTLVKWQSHKTGMTVDQMSEVLASLREVDSTVDLHGLLRHGIWGENLKALYDKHGPLIRAVQENRVVGRGLLELFASSDFEQTIDNIISHATTLSTTDPEWERLSTIAVDIVIKRGAFRPAPSIFVDGKWEVVTTENVEIFRKAIKDQIKRACSLTHLEKQAAIQRNSQLAEGLDHERNGFVIPHGTYTHVAPSGSLGGILTTGNFAGECLGSFSSGTDSYPGYVDLQQVDPLWGEEVTLGTLIKSQHLYTKESGQCVIIYLQESLDSEATKLESHIHGHYLVPGAIPTVDVSMILCEEIDAEDLEAAKVASIQSGVYVPLVDSKTFELLFTPEEYNQRYRESKRFSTLSDLIESGDVYEIDLYETPNTNPVYTVAQHMDQVCKYARHMIRQSSFTDELSQIILAAAKLHDVGKLDSQAQEIANVIKAGGILDQVADLTIERKRQILLLIKHDELLGEILKAMEISESGDVLISGYAKKKLQQLYRVFSDPILKQALVILYQADVRGIGGTEWQDWQVERKLTALGLPVFSIETEGPRNNPPLYP